MSSVTFLCCLALVAVMPCSLYERSVASLSLAEMCLSITSWHSALKQMYSDEMGMIILLLPCAKRTLSIECTLRPPIKTYLLLLQPGQHILAPTTLPPTSTRKRSSALSSSCANTSGMHTAISTLAASTSKHVRALSISSSVQMPSADESISDGMRGNSIVRNSPKSSKKVA